MELTPIDIIPVPPILNVAVSYDPAINYAFQQNAIPVIKELRFQNDATARKDLVVRVTLNFCESRSLYL